MSSAAWTLDPYFVPTEHRKWMFAPQKHGKFSILAARDTTMGPYLLAYPIRELALAAPLVIAVGGFAQAACYNARQQLPTNVLTQFMANPGQLQSKYPNGGAG